MASNQLQVSSCTGSNLSAIEPFCFDNAIMEVADTQSGQSIKDLLRIVSIVAPVLFGITFIVGLFGNGLVILVVTSRKYVAVMRTPTNILIVSLALADLLFVIFCIPFNAIGYALNQWHFGDWCCKLVQYLTIFSVCVSGYTLVLISLARFLAIVHPVLETRCTTVKAYIAIGVVWGFATVACLPVLFSHHVLHYEYAGGLGSSCAFNDEFYSRDIFNIVFMLSAYVIPLIIMGALYTVTLFRLWSRNPDVAPRGLTEESKKSVTKMLLVVVGVFAVCWLPFHVVFLLKSLELYVLSEWTVAIQIGAQVLGYMNSCCNPIIYALFSPNFRKAFSETVRCHNAESRHPSESDAARGQSMSLMATTVNL